MKWLQSFHIAHHTHRIFYDSSTQKHRKLRKIFIFRIRRLNFVLCKKNMKTWKIEKSLSRWIQIIKKQKSNEEDNKNSPTQCKCVDNFITFSRSRMNASWGTLQRRWKTKSLSFVFSFHWTWTLLQWSFLVFSAHFYASFLEWSGMHQIRRIGKQTMEINHPTAIMRDPSSKSKVRANWHRNEIFYNFLLFSMNFNFQRKDKQNEK